MSGVFAKIAATFSTLTPFFKKFDGHCDAHAMGMALFHSGELEELSQAALPVTTLDFGRPVPLQKK